jgi:hypothetical protein
LKNSIRLKEEFSLTIAKNTFTCFIAPQHPRNPIITRIQPRTITQITGTLRDDKSVLTAGSKRI